MLVTVKTKESQANVLYHIQTVILLLKSYTTVVISNTYAHEESELDVGSDLIRIIYGIDKVSYS